MATAARVLQVARSQIGYTEGRNDDTKYGRWYGMNNAPWCAIFVSWVASMAGASKIIPKHAYTPAGAQWFKDRGRWGTKPRVGAIVYFNFPGDGVNRISHVGIVEAVKADGSIVTIEGNTNAAGDRLGAGVFRKIRKVGIVGYGYPKYDTAPAPAKVVPLAASTKMGKTGWQVSDLKHVLVKAGYGPISDRTDYYGNECQKAVKRFHDSKAGAPFRGGDLRQIGPKGWAFLQRKIGRV
jgi:surface antigen